MHTVAEGFPSSFLSNPSRLKPFSVFTRARASISALIFVRCIQKHTCLWDPSGGKWDLAWQTKEEIPQAHMKLVSPVLTLRGILQLSELWGSTKVRKGSKMGSLGSNNKTREDERIGTNVQRIAGRMKGKEGEMKGKTERDAEGPRERLSQPELAV